MRVAVIGAGWAGAAAAWQLHQQGHHALVFEASHTPGGRARLYQSKVLGQTIDNGQHLLLGAYHSTLHLMQALGLKVDEHFYRFDLDIYSADQRFRFKTAPLPSPLHLAGALTHSTGLGLAPRWALIYFYSYLVRKRWRIPHLTVAELLQHTRQPPILVQKLWQPLCIAALNTPIDQACAQLFTHVLKDSLGAGRQATQMLIPLKNMTSLWPQAALKHAELHAGHTIRELQKTKDGYKIEQLQVDGIIIATNAPSCVRLLQTLDTENQHKEFVEQIANIQFNPIATLYLKPAHAWQNPMPMLMLDEDPQGLAAGQWVFNHAALPTSELGHIIAVTISHAGRLQTATKAQITQAIIQQLQQQCVDPLPPIVASELITEKRATFLATPGLQRPSMHTPWEGVKLAGDWVSNPYPAVLEGAVRSGLAAAKAL